MVSSTPRPHFTPWKDPVPIVQEAGWAPGPVWTSAENLASTGTRSPELPARTQSLYRLSYPAHSVDRNIKVVRKLDKVFEPHRTMFEEFQEEKKQFQYIASAKKKNTKNNNFFLWVWGGGEEQSFIHRWSLFPADVGVYLCEQRGLNVLVLIVWA